MEPTPEQQAVMSADAPLVLVNAFAGTGKTSTLVARAAHRRKRRLYLTFTRASKDDAKEKFGSLADVKSAHGLAFGAIGRQFRDRIATHIRPNDVQAAGLVPNLDGKMYPITYFAIETLKAFFYSCDASIGTAHLPGSMIAVGKSDHGKVLSIADAIWQEMRKPNGNIGMLHDCYLKMYHMSGPDIGQRYEEVMLDEAQDSNAVILDIALRASCQRVIVGDRHQSIYGFRRAVNAMEMRDGLKLALTQSFRFGPKIASAAGSLLRHWKNEPRMLKGRPDIADSVRAIDPKNVRTRTNIAYLGRTNFSVFGRAVDAVRHRLPIYFVGGSTGYRLDIILDAWRLKETGQATSFLLRHFDSFDQMVERAYECDDKELKLLHSIISEYDKEIPSLIERIKDAETRNEAGAVILSTAHKSKGLQFETVVLEQGFFEGVQPGAFPYNEFLRACGEEVNLLYVAMTRAIRHLMLPPECFRAAVAPEIRWTS